MTTTSLWGDLSAVAAIRTPAEILKEQGELLKSDTRGALFAHPVTGTEGSNFSIRYLLMAPALNNYSYEIFKATHDISMYPVVVRGADGFNPTSCTDEAAFTRHLAAILSSPKVRNVITGLLAQIRASST